MCVKLPQGAQCGTVCRRRKKCNPMLRDLKEGVRIMKASLRSRRLGPNSIRLSDMHIARTQLTMACCSNLESQWVISTTASQTEGKCWIDEAWLALASSVVRMSRGGRLAARNQKLRPVRNVWSGASATRNERNGMLPWQVWDCLNIS